MRYSDLLLVAAVVFILAMMILPMPAWLIDILVAVNIVTGLLLLLVALYINSALEFSAFPSVLLISTLFRLALSIATTRLILLHGEGGHIIDTFGRVVVGGNLVVGLVVFLIITVVQFIVVAKGAERVAEVSARFTLDAMPGKQMSIDSDLRSGLIDKDEARRRRRALEDESKLHGNLDGAMKFVKGDAIAGLVIIAVNLLGGFAVGMFQNNMSAAAAMVKYSVLTVGDGMVTQIPALLSAMAAGLIVTRSAGDERESDLGQSIANQLAGKPKVLLVAGGLCFLLMLIPGFPWPVFLILGTVLAFSGVLRMPHWSRQWQRWVRPARESLLKRKEHVPGEMVTDDRSAQPSVPLLLVIPAQILSAENSHQLMRELEGVLDTFNLKLGLMLPRITVRCDGFDGSDQAQWQLLAFEVPIARGSMSEVEGPGHLAGAVRQALRRHVALFVGTQDASKLLVRVGEDMPEVVKEVMRALPVQRVADVLRRLVEEEVAIRNVRDLFEALADAAQKEKDPYTLTELVRIGLKRQICHQAAPDQILPSILITRELEELIRESVHVTNGIQHLTLDPSVSQAISDQLASVIQKHRPKAVVAAVDIRRHVRKLIETQCFDTPVLSFHELVPSLQLEVLARVGGPETQLLEAT